MKTLAMLAGTVGLILLAGGSAEAAPDDPRIQCIVTNEVPTGSILGIIKTVTVETAVVQTTASYVWEAIQNHVKPEADEVRAECMLETPWLNLRGVKLTLERIK